MSKTLAEIAEQLSTAGTIKRAVPVTTKDIEEPKPIPKVQLIYAFNGTGKTRLSKELKQRIAPKTSGSDEASPSEPSRTRLLYYNAFTEDLFYWDNDLAHDSQPILKIQPNSFTDWVLEEQGQDQNIVSNFQRYVGDKLTPRFNAEYEKVGSDGKVITVKKNSEVTFSLETGDETHSKPLKTSKGEESCFIWSVFYTLLEQVVAILSVDEPADRETNEYDKLEYVLIDDPVSSLDDNHLIELAVDLAALIKSNKSQIKFIISTHNPLFFNVLVNELGSDDKSYSPSWRSKWFAKTRLEKLEDGTFQLIEQLNDSPFSYHLHLMSQLDEVIKSGQIEKYHFNLLRNILEKTATFLGYKRWEQLLLDVPGGNAHLYAKRIINFSSHSKHSGDEVTPLKPEEKKVLERLVNHLVNHHRFWQGQ